MSLIVFLNGKPSLDELCEHIRVGTKWYIFGILLKLDITKLDSIDQQYKDDDNKVLSMFEF